MCDLKICRICMRTECKFYKYDQTPLKLYYEEVMGFKINSKDKLPQYFCYECTALLHKFHKFKEKCFRGLNTLQDLLFKNSLTYNEVREIYRKSKAQPPFNMNLSIIKVSKNVGTYNFEYEEDEYWEYEMEIDVGHKAIVSEDHDLDEKVINEPVKCKNEAVNDFGTCDLKNNDVITSNIKLDDSKNNDLGESKLDTSNDNDFDDDYFDDNLNSTVESDSKNPQNDEIENDRVTSPISSDDEVLAKKALSKVDNEETVPETKKVPKFQRSKRGPSKLSEGNWKKMNLSEQDALERFESRASDVKYLSAQYNCKLCYKWFSNGEIYHRHVVLRHNESLPLVCKFCKMRFKLGHQLQKHMKEHYNLYQCQRCFFVCPLEQSAIFHDESHNGKIRTCNICFKQFTHSSTYYSHMTTHRTNFICTLCGRSFVSEMGLDVHKKRTHIELQSQDKKATKESSENDQIYCERCDIKFEARAAFEEHLFHSAKHAEDIVDRNHELLRFQRKVCGIREKAVLAEEIRMRREQDPELALTKPMKMRRIYNRSSKKTPMNCYQCGLHFDSQMSCRKHHLRAHPRTTFVSAGATERTICEICGADLAFGSIMSHLNMHSREKLYKCEVCERTFVQNATLKRHMIVHTGERPFPCTMCEKRFTQAASVALHIRTVHLKQPHPKRNRRKKTEFNCLEERPTTHTGERPYPCKLCGKRFTQSNSQKLHYRTVHLKEPHPKRNRKKKLEEPQNEVE